MERNIESPSLPRQLYMVTGLHPHTTYEFRVRGATIENGVVMWGQFSISFDITTEANGKAVYTEFNTTSFCPVCSLVFRYNLEDLW